ncbi:MAG: formate dehydrogenase accessory protein FdhE [Gammaproteobacteria bacterium]|nr:formate dehydrogenase accessory protein FdhE [Gammaproteobacteria bacterium]MBU1479064.1 formate dehydrogenase accessory protein FdhE [Gammaproteobacteria bacterium]MBU2000411.1 formate dehydrogenase accessory protein FdhE [Gammaproteobacteria bacterium]MBU2130446.1 formate dehydrogenase accessory protein FdhE [Gammaproteobacteria bacterium]MBU2185601.1 formate dehydrogenase accessory protein FdhE [Gammaproteobacteria bacterium]
MTSACQIPLATSEQSPLTIANIIAADPLATYLHRVKRLQTLQKDHELKEYLNLCERLVKAQANLIEQGDFGPPPKFDIGKAKPLAAEFSADNHYWLGSLQSLLSELLPLGPKSVAKVIREMMQLDQAKLADYGRSLREGKLSDVPASYSLFIWAALAVYWSHWAPLVIKRMDQSQLKQQSLCPVCGSHPVASVIRDETRTGLRYLHCSLCETQWHYVRAQCTNCEQDEDMSLWTLDDYQANIRIESCDACHGYTKMLFIEKSPHMDVVADDLASLMLDNALNVEGYKSTTVNPLLLAHETE